MIEPRVDTTFQLDDGRKLGYAEYGVTDGRPVFLFHGNPGSRYEWMRVSDPQIWRGLRVIAPERPGFGLSDFQPHRTHIDWAQDIAALADHLGLDTFSVIGFSAGGAHALACAAVLSERVERLGLISCVAPLEVPGITQGMSWRNKKELLLARASYPAARLWMRRSARRALSSTRIWSGKAASEAEREKRNAVLRNLEEAFRQGGRGSAYELALRSRPWAFDVTKITTETYLWQGEDDDNVPPPMGRYLARILPNCEATFVPGARHTLHHSRMDEILSKVMDR